MTKYLKIILPLLIIMIATLVWQFLIPKNNQLKPQNIEEITITNEPDKTKETTQKPEIIKEEITEFKRFDFSQVSPIYLFNAEIPEDWQVEYLPATEALNIYLPETDNNLEASQIFIRYFKASSFLTLNTVDILSRQETEVNSHPAVRYEIIKKPAVADFTGQPGWRSKQHKLIDIRYSDLSPTTFYVFSYSPELDEKIFNQFIDSLIFFNDRQSFSKPLDYFSERITKKPFGIYITPDNSPVEPEIFTGYHTGTDLEILPGEENKEITVKAICTGKLINKRQVSGYGGLAIQECLLDNQPITIIYGHLSLDSINHQINDLLASGEVLGLLGKGYSEETDNERKHLHLGIHKGTGAEIRGYTSNQKELNNWLDPETIFVDNL